MKLSTKLRPLLMTVLLGLVAIPLETRAQTETILHVFHHNGDGLYPFGSLVRDKSGNLYGTTVWGGRYNWGTIFKIDSSGNETISYSFTGGSDGANPDGGLIRDSAGNLYGTAGTGGDLKCMSGGANTGCGTIFKVDSSGRFSVLYAFTGAPDGAYPSGLFQDASGNFYGTTSNGGTGAACGTGCGTVFKLDSTGHETVLYSFAGLSDGNSPRAGVVRDAKGNIYGTTYLGGELTCGPNGCGTVFKVDAKGVETVVHTFTGGTDGNAPFDALITDGSSLDGTTSGGGIYGFGTVFRIDKSGNKTVLYNFTGTPDGAGAATSLVRDSAGNLYGTTFGGGASGLGTVFKIDPTGKETVLHSFTLSADGKDPQAGLILDSAGNLYGTTYYSSANGFGTVFKIAP